MPSGELARYSSLVAIERRAGTIVPPSLAKKADPSLENVNLMKVHALSFLSEDLKIGNVPQPTGEPLGASLWGQATMPNLSTAFCARMLTIGQRPPPKDASLPWTASVKRSNEPPGAGLSLSLTSFWLNSAAAIVLYYVLPSVWTPAIACGVLADASFHSLSSVEAPLVSSHGITPMKYSGVAGYRKAPVRALICLPAA